jgi:hypothetical protein
MTFLVRQISRSAEGREIIRPSEVAGERLTIGRDPASNIHLTDLSVALQHAVLQKTGPMRLSVSAEEGVGIELNGRKVTSGVIDLATGGEIRIGTQLVRVLPAGAEAGQISIDVEKVGESAEDELDAGDVHRFSVGAALPGKRITAYALIAVVLAIFLAWPVWIYSERREQPTDQRQIAGFAADSMWSSGALSQVHHDLEQNCSACHVRAFEPVRDTACLNCHQNIENHGDTSRPPQEAAMRMARSQPDLTGFARFQLAVANAFGHNPGRCVDCHTEHEGPQEMPRTAQRFCSDCHADLDSRLPDTRLANAVDFGRNAPNADREGHPQFRPLVLINWNGEQPQMARVPIDRNPAENSNLKFPHALHLNPTGGVTQMTRRLAQRYEGRQQLGCADCHQVTPDGTTFQPVDMEEDCGSCHSLAFDQQGGTFRTLRHGSPEQVVADLREYYRGRGPARPAELGPVARRRPGDISQVRSALQYARAQAGVMAQGNQAIAAVFRQGGACYDCHVIDQRGPMDFHVRPVAFPTRYLLHGWFDHRQHQVMRIPGQTGSLNGDQACLGCHVATQSNQASNLLIPGLESCQRCHGGEGSSSQVPSGCAMCHDYHMDEGQPAMLLRQRVRGNRWETTRTRVESLGPIAARR